MGGQGGFGNDIFEEFEKFFGGGGGKQQRGSSSAGRGGKGNDIVLNLDLDFMEAVNGIEKTISFARVDICTTCKGSRSKPGTSPSTCNGCGG
jgi:molecular chaperone DnaJ